MQERRLAVLRAIVEDYVTTREPVGSKALVDRHRLGSLQRRFAMTWPRSRRKG